MSRFSRSIRASLIVTAALAAAVPAAAQARNGLLIAEWEENDVDPDLGGYRIFASTDPNVFDLTPAQARTRATTVVVSAGSTEATLASLETDKTYYVAATCFDVSGNESGFSNVVAAQPCAASTSGSVTIEWDPDEDPDLASYNVYIAEDPDVFEQDPRAVRSRLTPTRVGREKTRLVVAGLDVERTYYATVTSTGAHGGETAFSAVLAVTATVIPTVCTVQPDIGTQGASSLTVTLNGANFDAGATVSFGPGISVVQLDTSQAPSRLTATLDIDPMARVDSRDVVIANPGGGSSTRFDAFDVSVDVDRVDIDDSERVDGGDLIQIAAVFGARSGQGAYTPSLDLNVDGVIDGSDLSLLIALFGRVGPF